MDTGKRSNNKGQTTVAKANTSEGRKAGNWQGQNWARPDLRLALYMRDGLGCCYCSQGVEHGARLTLDHILPASMGGTNAAGNLVTACNRCNSVRGIRPIDMFAADVATYVNDGRTAESILAHVRACLERPIDRAAARAMIALRGSCAKAVKAGAK
jgi:hypothetical protein